MANFRWLDFFTSVRLTIVLLLGLATSATLGTIKPLEENRYELYYQSPLFRLLLLLLALNLLACTWKTLRRNLADRQRLGDRLATHSGTVSINSDPTELLQSAGFHLTALPDGVLAWRGRPGRWGSTLVHLSLLLILLGGTLSSFGFIGTTQIAVGETSDQYFDWGTEQDTPLGFTLRLDDFQLQYYPIDVRFSAYEPMSKTELADIITREGESVDLPLPGLTAQVVRFVPFDQTLTLDILQNGRKIGTYLTPSNRSKEAPIPNFLDQQLLLRLTGFRDPVIRQYQSKVSVLEDGQVVKQALVEVNHPLVHRGIAIYQTAWNQDEFGFYYSGFQLSKDPGEPLVWAGSILLVLGLYAAFTVRYRAIGVVRDGDGWQLLPLTGCGDERGRELLERLTAATAD
jgi:cytochrome c biogenesis protein